MPVQPISAAVQTIRAVLAAAPQAEEGTRLGTKKAKPYMIQKI